MWLPYVFNKVTFAVARFAGFYSTLFWAIGAIPLLSNLRTHPLPADIPFRQEIYISQWISGVLVSYFVGIAFISEAKNF
jgi:hypothetical protein